MEGIPSLGGPPDIISEKSIDVLLKSVFLHPSIRHSAGVAPAGMEAAKIAKRTNAATSGRKTYLIYPRMMASSMTPREGPRQSITLKCL